MSMLRDFCPSALVPGDVTVKDHSWSIYPLSRSLGAYAAEWDRLNQQVMHGHPMLDSRFIDSLLVYFGDGSERLCRFGAINNVSGLCILKRGKPGIWTTFRPGQTQLAPVILSGVYGLDQLLRKLPGPACQLDLLCQDPDFRPSFSNQAAIHEIMPHVLTINVRLDGGFEAYWRSRSRNLQRSIRGRENRLTRNGVMSRWRRLTAPEDMHPAVTRFGELEMTGWKGRADTAVSVYNAQGMFYSRVLQQFAKTGQAAVYELWLGDRLAASELTLNNGQMLLLLKTAYDENLAGFGPGRLLLREIIRDAFAIFSGGVIEFYTCASAEERAWATGERWVEHVTLYRSTLTRSLIAATRVARAYWQRAIGSADGFSAVKEGHCIRN